MTGLQPRELRRRAGDLGGVPPADPLRDGPPHLPDAGAEVRLPHRARRSRSRRRRRTRRCSSGPMTRCARSSRRRARRHLPRGKLTSDGEMNEFRGGIMKILGRRRRSRVTSARTHHASPHPSLGEWGGRCAEGCRRGADARSGVEAPNHLGLLAPPCFPGHRSLPRSGRPALSASWKSLVWRSLFGETAESRGRSSPEPRALSTGIEPPGKCDLRKRWFAFRASSLWSSPERDASLSPLACEVRGDYGSG